MSVKERKLLTFSVSSKQETSIRSRVKTRSFSFIVDVPKDLGRSDEAPNPVAKELGIDFGRIGIDIDGHLNPDRLFGTSFADRAGYKSIRVLLRTGREISDERRREWLRITENRCPVNDNLKYPTPIGLNAAQANR